MKNMYTNIWWYIFSWWPSGFHYTACNIL